MLAAAETAAKTSKYGCKTGDDFWRWQVYYAAVDCDSLIHEFEAGVDWDKYERSRIEARTAKAQELGLIEEGAEVPARCDYTADLFRG